MALTLAKAIQDALVGHLQTVPGLEGVPLIGRRRGTIVNDIEAEVARLGACLYVMPPLPVEVSPESPGPYVDRYELRIRVIEAPAINTSAPDAYELAETVLRAVHHLTLPAIPGGNPILCDRAPIREIEDPQALIFDLIFHVSTGYPTGT